MKCFLFALCGYFGLVVVMAGCAGWLYRPGGPTDTAIHAGTGQLAQEADLNQDGIVAAEEAAYATRKAAEDGDWETLIWLLLAFVGGVGVSSPIAYRRGLHTPVPAKGG